MPLGGWVATRLSYEHFFKPWGIVLNGTVDWQGEESGDAGSIKIENGEIMWQEFLRVEGEWKFA